MMMWGECWEEKPLELKYENWTSNITQIFLIVCGGWVLYTLSTISVANRGWHLVCKGAILSLKQGIAWKVYEKSNYKQLAIEWASFETPYEEEDLFIFKKIGFHDEMILEKTVLKCAL